MDFVLIPWFLPCSRLEFWVRLDALRESHLVRCFFRPNLLAGSCWISIETFSLTIYHGKGADDDLEHKNPRASTSRIMIWMLVIVGSFFDWLVTRKLLG